jgi:hypothetical protein
LRYQKSSSSTPAYAGDQLLGANMFEFGDFWASSNLSSYTSIPYNPQLFFGSSLGSYYGLPQSDFMAPQHYFTLPPTSPSPIPPVKLPAPAPESTLPTRMSSTMEWSPGVMDYYGGVSTGLSTLTAAAAGPVASTASWIETQVAHRVIAAPSIVGGMVTLGQVSYAAFGSDNPKFRDIVMAAGSTVIGTLSTEAVGFSLATRAAAAIAIGATPLAPVTAAIIMGGTALGSSLVGALATGAAYDHFTMDQLEALADRVLQKVRSTIGFPNDS